ncbi:MAG: HAD family hydrolase [Acidobacteria bacterium]|nr:HAD family hydrolase [Acidobacteriota bacterium]
MRPLLMFDMDGVLVEVTESYRETIRQTVTHFTGKPVTYDDIQAYKNAGGWNNDWKLSQKMAADLGVAVDYDTVIGHFQKIFIGDGDNGLIHRERWIARPGVLESLGEAFDFGVYTGRDRFEAMITLNRSAGLIRFHPILTANDVTHGKPHPEGLLKVQAMYPGRALYYIGDTVDDARCARAAGVPFIGVASQAHSTRATLLDLFARENAAAVLDDINQLENYLAQGRS